MLKTEIQAALETLCAYFADELRAVIRDELATAQMTAQQPTRLPILTPKQAALEYGLPADDWRGLVGDETLPNLGKPGAIKIPRWAIEEWLHARR